ncbi:MAG: phosphate propanoyltransferase [Nitrospirae bacterium]|nr:MAG: phosphate propanoyltransferase [Nitrospirota bacterium]
MAKQCARALHFNEPKCLTLEALSAEIPINVSAHHVHLSKEDFEELFGKGAKLTPGKPLYQPGQFAAKETVSLIGPKGRIDNVRILGPFRNKTQVEISCTEQFKLGLHAPIRDSGHLEGTPGIIIEGPKGRVELPEGVICAKRHIHMSPEEAEKFGLHDGDTVMVSIEGEGMERELIYGDVLIRVSPNYKLEMHVDTDEANAANFPRHAKGRIIQVHTRCSCGY